MFSNSDLYSKSKLKNEYNTYYNDDYKAELFKQAVDYYSTNKKNPFKSKPSELENLLTSYLTEKKNNNIDAALAFMAALTANDLTIDYQKSTKEKEFTALLKAIGAKDVTEVEALYKAITTKPKSMTANSLAKPPSTGVVASSTSSSTSTYSSTVSSSTATTVTAPSGINPAKFQANLQELKRYNLLPAVTDDNLQDYAVMGAILSDETIVAAQLDRLEQMVRERAIAKGVLGNRQLEAVFFDTSSPKKFKLLSDVLYDWAVANGFGTKTVKLLRPLIAAEFTSVLSQGIFFKDNGAGEAHASWTHFIQLFVIVEFNKKAQVLKSDPYSLYKMFGGYIPSNLGGKAIWDIIMDATSGASARTDFRRPENLQAYLLENKYRYPLIQTTLKKGNKKIYTLNPFKEKDHTERAVRLGVK